LRRNLKRRAEANWRWGTWRKSETSCM